MELRSNLSQSNKIHDTASQQATYGEESLPAFAPLAEAIVARYLLSKLSVVAYDVPGGGC